MSHIERKKIKGRYYLYRYQCYRDVNGKVKKKLLAYLGPESDFENVLGGPKQKSVRKVKGSEG
jgi:hypothetical protein